MIRMGAKRRQSILPYTAGNQDNDGARPPFLERILRQAVSAVFMRLRAIIVGFFRLFSRESKWY